MEFTIGTDAEFFLKNRDGHFVSAIPFIGSEAHGTKHNPIRFKDGATLQRDNVAVEFATRVATGKEDFINSIREAMQNMWTVVPKDFKVCAIPSVVFRASELTHPEAMEFGCDPDFNAWDSGTKNPKPCAINSRLRTAGAHIHVGHEALWPTENKMKMIRIMDELLGIVSVILDGSREAIRRKQLYGKAGAFRPTEYGVEYRVLSNFWLKNVVCVGYIYDLVEIALFLVSTYRDFNDRNIQDIINSNNKILAIKHFDDLCCPGTGPGDPIFMLPGLINCLLHKPRSLKQEWRVN